MVNAQPDMVPLGDLIGRIAADQYSIPDFQREFVWNAEDIRQLVRSLFNQYFIGSLLLWNLRDATMQELLGCKSLLALHQVNSDTEESQQAKGSNSPPFTAPPVTVLDGQQRLTAMYYAFFDHDLSLDGKALRFFVDIKEFMGNDPNDAGKDNAFICRDGYRGINRTPPSSLEDNRDGFALYHENQLHEFPLRLLSTGDDSEWLSEYQRFWHAKARGYDKRATEHGQQAQMYFRKAEDADEAAGAEYATHFKTREQYREAVEVAEQNAANASNDVAAKQAQIDELRRDYHYLDNQLKQSSNSAKKRDYGRERHQLDLQISRAEYDLGTLEDVAAETRKDADQRADDMRRLTDAEQSMTAGPDHPDPDTLRVQAYDEQKAQERYSDLAREAEAHALRGRDFRNHVMRLRSDVRIPVMVLPEDVSEIAVSETFQQINRRGTKLRPFELLNAVVSLQDVSPRNMLRAMLPTMEAEGLSWDRTQDDLVRMMFIRTHPESRYELDGDAYEGLVPGMLPTGANRASPLIKSAEDFRSHWESVQQGYLLGLRALRDETHYGKNVPDNPGHFVPFNGMIPVYCSLVTDAGGSVIRRLRVNQWYWASVLTERYSSSGSGRQSSRIGSQDYREVRAWFTDDEAVPEAVNVFRNEFGFGLFSAANGQQRTRAQGFVEGVRNLMFTFTPCDWLDGNEIPAANVNEYEIVPVAQCAQMGVGNTAARSVFNTMLVDQASQEDIQENLPNVYLPGFLRQLRSELQRKVLASHCISNAAYDILCREPFTASDFEEFLRERQAEFLRRIAVEVFTELDLELPK